MMLSPFQFRLFHKKLQRKVPSYTIKIKQKNSGIEIIAFIFHIKYIMNMMAKAHTHITYNIIVFYNTCIICRNVIFIYICNIFNSYSITINI